MEERLVLIIENGIRAIKMGTKTPQEAELGKIFTKLKPLNEPMYLDLMERYKKVLNKSK